MQWQVHGERSLYESDWVSLRLVDVEPPGVERFEHHVVRLPNQASGTIVHDPDRGVLLLWRHRFVTDSWGWELPAGVFDPGETADEAAARECLEETGWRAGPLTHLFSYYPMAGVIDQTFHVFYADGATLVGDPVDRTESERIEWVPVDEVRRQLRAGGVTEGMSVTGLTWGLAHGVFD